MKHIPSVALAVFLCLCLQLGVQAQSTVQHVTLRGFGPLTVTPRFYPSERSSWITFTAQDAPHAALCGSKFLADLRGFGDIKPVGNSGLPGTVAALAGTAWWLIGRHGSSCEVLCARSQSGLVILSKRAAASSWLPVASGAYPPWLDGMDNSSVGFWFLGGGALPKDVNSDFEWLKDQGFTACIASGVDQTRLVAPGVLDTTADDWYATKANELHIPYRMLLDWTAPSQPTMVWNQIPLPYLAPAEGAVPYADFQHQRMSIYDGFVYAPKTDPYMFDLRKRLAEHQAKDPYFIGSHGSEELGNQTLVELSRYAGMSSTAAAWHTYLQHDLGLSLAQVGLRYHGDVAAYSAWSDVGVPSMKDFTGWNQGSLDLSGMWEGHSDPQMVGAAAKWAGDGAPAAWTPVRSNEVMLLEYETGDGKARYWLRRKVNLTAAQCASLKYIHIARAGWHALAPVEAASVYLNGQLLTDETVDHPLWPDQDQCLDVGGTAHAGENDLVIQIRGPLSYVFLSPVGRWAYPSADKHQNLLWYDAIDFTAVYVLQEVENNLRATRAGDPNRPIKIMAPWELMDRLPDLCLKYGAYPHDTGQGSGVWGPWMPRYASWRGIATSSEPGGPANSPDDLRMFMTFYMMLGNSMVDTVFDVSEYSGDPTVAKWITDNREMMRCIGKMDTPNSSIAVLRSIRSVRLNYQAPWGWDMARGDVQQAGRTADYVDLPDFLTDRADRFKVIIDDGTGVMTSSEVDAISRYVKQGGIFVATNVTGMDSPEAANTWPISSLTGLHVVNANGTFGTIAFVQDQSLWPSLRGKTLKGGGMALDWRKTNLAGPSRALAADAADVKVVARWTGALPGRGDVAVATRKIGKGMVVTLASSFWRSAQDENGHWISRTDLTTLFDEFLNGLGVPRESWVTGDTPAISSQVWAEHWRSKNGVYDVYPVARINTDAKQPPLSANIHLRSDQAVSTVTDLAVNGHPAIGTTSGNGSFTLPPVALNPMESHVYAAPRPDIEHSALYWLGVQERQWRALAPVDKTALPPVPTADPHILPLIDDWRMTTGHSGSDWILPAYHDAQWKKAKIGSFAAMKIDENSVAQFRREITIPKTWSGQHLSLVFDTSYWFWGVEPHGQFWINGKPEPVSNLSGSHQGAFSIDVSSEVQTGRITLALEVDGPIKPGGTPRSRPAGVTGAFYLQASPQPVEVVPLTDWRAATDVNVFTPIVPGQSQPYKYLETTFTLPANWPGKRLFLTSPGPLRWLILNDQVVSAPDSMHTLDISGLVRKDGKNVLRWMPDVDWVENPARDSTLTGPLRPLSLNWLP